MREGLKAASVFIGTVIGAGFATGKEVALYFGKTAPVIAVFSGLLLGFLCSFFMHIGKISGGENFNGFLLKKRKGVVDAILFICAFITFTAMFSGAEVLIRSTFGISHIGIPTVIAAAVIAVKGLKSLKTLNSLLVPVIVVLIAVIFVRCGRVSKEGGYNFLNGIAYAALNIMLAGAVMVRLGAGASDKTIASAGVVSGVVLAVILGMIALIVTGRESMSMPMFEAAKSVGLKNVSGILIFASVFTTMVSALELAAQKFRAFVPDKRLSALTVCLMAYPVVLIFEFDEIVAYFYPVVSVFGVLMLIVALIRYAALKLNAGKIP